MEKRWGVQGKSIYQFLRLLRRTRKALGQNVFCWRVGLFGWGVSNIVLGKGFLLPLRNKKGNDHPDEQDQKPS
ncbi:hypothetical protein DN752_14735 [Echinicola strongylocentroti]|uniref:Uncharacterized protein n=1 Tax=Echinicola strongylocentroti TaxID=1795355 RepID=A0A2Z4IKN5_9BACT|nr:hypothetical protein DN752_14735 [Echinicola strongylocentroti]